jgi:kumamolisin
MATRPRTPAIPQGYSQLKGSERRPGPTARLLGPADPNEIFSATIVLRRRPDGAPTPTAQELARVPLNQRRRLPEAEFAAKYGASPDDIDAVTRFAAAKGLRVVDANAARRSVIVSGAVAQMGQAFGVTLGRYEVAATRNPRSAGSTAKAGGAAPALENYRGRDGFIYVPQELEDAVIGVFGLDNRNITKQNGAGDPPDYGELDVPTVAGFYKFPNSSAAGQTIAIVSYGGNFNGYDTSPGPNNDITQYFSSSLPAGYKRPTIINVPPAAGANNGNPDNETTQDICIAATVAQGATIAVYFLSFFSTGQNSWHDLFARIVTPAPGDLPAGVNPPSVVSCSLYVSDGDDAATLMHEGVSAGFVAAIHMALQDAATQFITVCSASGDQGSDSKVGSEAGINAFNKNFGPDGNAHVQYPGSDPYILSCGGTTIGSDGGSFEEYVWNDTADNTESLATPTWATGGGVSDYFTASSLYAADYDYQSGAPGTRALTPDIRILSAVVRK